MNIVEYVAANKEWLFAGAGITALVAVGTVVRKLFGRHTNEGEDNPARQPSLNAHQIVNVNVNAPGDGERQKAAERQEKSWAVLKNTKFILFIDDETGFKIVGGLRKTGWKNVEIVADIKRLDSDKLLSADVVFVDIQGVGRALNFTKEGLGLMRAIKQQYPQKKVVIYSAVDKHDIFADEIALADGKMRKTAEVYEFERKIIDLLQ